jgi:competence protein ComEC
LLILIFTILVNINFHNNLKITFISVGQGESALIQTPEGKNILIDCGPLRADFDSGENIIAPYLKRNDIKNIDLLILTHNHNDHAGGSNFIIKNFFVKKVLINFDDYNIYFEKLLSPRNFELQSIKCGDVIKIDNLKLYVLYPFDSTRNGSPLVILMKYKDESILFTSDISKDEERNISVFYGDFLKSNILKVSHHGSKNSSSPELLAKCRPEYSVISCGLNNRFNHPAAVTLEKLEFLNSNIYRTDLDGAVIFESDGYSLKLKNE